MRAVGIDLGNTKAVVAALRQGEPEALPNRERSPLTPCLLSLGPGGELALGPGPEGLGGVSLAAAWSAPSGVAFAGREYTGQELVALFLARLREGAEAALGEPVQRAVLAVPVSFGQADMARLLAAARQAGLVVMRVVHSPVAAALAYSLAHPGLEGRTLLVYDLGGGCLDVAVVQLFPGALTALGLAGESWLGGEDLTGSIVAYVLRQLQGERRLLLDETQAARQGLRAALRREAEQAKVALSIVDRVSIFVPGEAIGSPRDVGEVLTRGEFEKMVRPRLEESLEVAGRALAQAGLAAEHMESILLVGGSTQVPLLRELLAERYPQAPVVHDLNPLLSVALGAGALAGMAGDVSCPACSLANPVEAVTCQRCGASLAGEERVTCHSCFLPNDVRREVCWKCGASLRGARQRRHRWMAGRTCPRCGAPMGGGGMVCPACQAPLVLAGPGGLRCGCGRVLEAGAASCPACGQLVAPFVGDVSSRGLGVEAGDGRLDPILPAGQGLPSAQPVYRAFAARSGQEQIEVTLYEGDRPMARDNRCCGRLRLGLPEGVPAGTSVRVGFALDRNGMLCASASLGDGTDREVDVALEWGD